MSAKMILAKLHWILLVLYETTGPVNFWLISINYCLPRQNINTKTESREGFHDFCEIDLLI